MVAHGQNGEPLRPEQGYPDLALLVPGWEGNDQRQVAAARRKVLDQPAMGPGSASKYRPDARRHRRQFTFRMEAKSLITRPSGGDTLSRAGLSN